MGHIAKEKPRLLGRVRRIRGQVEAIERALDSDTSCAEVLQLIASVRGAMNGLMGELMEEHLRNHVVIAEDDAARAQGADDLIRVIRTYLK